MTPEEQAATLAAKDERIAQLERSNEFITRCFDEREKALSDAYTKCGQLKERVADLEQQLHGIESLKLAVRSMEKYTEKRVAVAKIEGLKMARNISECVCVEMGEYENRWSINEVIDRIDAEIGKLTNSQLAANDSHD